MILGFKQKFKDGEPTNFREKILAGIDKEYSNCYTPKIHSIRKGYRWDAGRIVQMAYGVRTTNYQQFNVGIKPLQKCISTQFIGMTFNQGHLVITVDTKFLFPSEIEKLIQNDGLTTDQFMKFFFINNGNEWHGQIVHWTNFKY